MTSGTEPPASRRYRVILTHVLLGLAMGLGIAAGSALLSHLRDEPVTEFETDRLLARLVVWAVAGALWGAWEWRRRGRAALSQA